MQRNVSPVVAIIVILVVVAVVAFAWMKLTAGEKPTGGPGMPGGPSQMGSRRGGSQEGSTDTSRTGRRGRRGGATSPGEESPPGGASEGAEADEDEG
jgi:hypothetical protein